MRKAFIDQIMLGFFLIATVVIFLGSVSDELEARNKYINLKKILQTTALSAAKYYVSKNDNILESQNIALGIIDKNPLGSQIKDDITFIWDLVSTPKNVKVKLLNYTENFFWLRLLNLDSYTFQNLEAKANIIITPTDELPIVNEVSNFMPFAINECGSNDLTPGKSFSFIYKTYAIYDKNDSTGFYGLDGSNPDREDGSQSGFAHFKNEVLDFNRLETQEYLVDSDQDTIENDAQQLASALEVHKFDEPMNISIALLDCNSTKDDVSIVNLVDVNMTNIYCGSKTTSEDTVESVFENETGFDNVVWVNWVEDKDCSQSGLFRIDIEILRPDITSVMLEY